MSDMLKTPFTELERLTIKEMDILLILLLMMCI